MSDFHEVKGKLKEGIDWRGTARVSIDDEEYELTVRQLQDPEFEEVMSLVDKEELQQLQSDLPEDTLEEYRDLRSQEDLDEDEEERFIELEEQLKENSTDLFDVLSSTTFEGIRRCAKYGVEPDEEDLREAFVERASDIEVEYGIKVTEPDDVYDPLKEEYEELVERSTKFIAFEIGIQVLVATLDDEGN